MVVQRRVSIGLREIKECFTFLNKELMDKFDEMLQKEPSLGYVYNLAKESERMMQATLRGNTKTMEEILSYVHNAETLILKKRGDLCMKPVSFEDYRKELKSLDLDAFCRIHEEMLAEIGNDPDGLELYDELAKASAKYAEFRGNWLLMTREEKNLRDESRTSCHNSLIVKFNQLARYLKMQGKQAGWRDELGYEEEDPNNRKRIGDFGCWIAFVNSVNAR